MAKARTLQGDDLLSTANMAIGLIYQKKSDLVYYISLDKMNDSLMHENARLRLAVSNIKSLDTLSSYKVSKELYNTDTTVHEVRFANYKYRTARVINNSVNSVNNYVTINIGSKEGVARGMGVISGTGLVGYVVHVSNHFSTVLSIMSKQQLVSARLKDGTYGFTSWDVEKPEVFIMKDMPQEAKIYKNDSIYTTSYSHLFPPDVLIGTVDKVYINKRNGQKQLVLRPATNFRKLMYVYVVENIQMPERKDLEDSTTKAK
jgi:rod shape-determining protein MreC